MPNTSLNPRASALSPHALKLLRPLLRRIALWHRERLGETKADDFEVEFDDIDAADVIYDPEKGDELNLPLQMRLNQPYGGSPAGEKMSEADISQAITTGCDPWAEDTGTCSAKPLSQPPIRLMSIAARLTSSFETAAEVENVTRPRTFNLLTVPSQDDREALWRDGHVVFSLLAELANPSEAAWRGFAFPTLGSANDDSPSRAQGRLRDYHKSMASAVRQGQKVFALAPDETSFSAVGNTMCNHIISFPSFTREMCIEILRVTHSATGEVAEGVLRELLPPDHDLAALPLAVVEGAFREETTIAVAKALAAAATRLHRPSGTTLADVVLTTEVAEPINHLVQDISEWRRGSLAWDDISSSILLHGPPGNGKTLLASAVAGSIRGQLVATSYSECQKFGHQGDMLRALSERVEEAIRMVPSVFFLDELDSFTHRNSLRQTSDYIVGVVNGLLEHLTRLNQTPGVIVMGATNFPDMIDPAIIRPGRFDLHLEIGPPDRAGIVRLLKNCIGKMGQVVDLSSIADQLLGASAAQVAALVREARGLARAERKDLGKSHLAKAADRIAGAPNIDVLWRLALHEAGHMVVAAAIGLGFPERASLTYSGGEVSFRRPPYETRSSAIKRITALLGGHAAETLIFDNTTNGSGLGAGSDLALATEMAGKMLFEWGMGASLMHTPFRKGNDLRLGDRTDRAVEEVLQSCFGDAHCLTQEHIKKLHAVANVLLEERELSGDRCKALLRDIFPSSQAEAVQGHNVMAPHLDR